MIYFLDVPIAVAEISLVGSCVYMALAKPTVRFTCIHGTLIRSTR